jgi:hypothetical protein
MSMKSHTMRWERNMLWENRAYTKELRLYYMWTTNTYRQSPIMYTYISLRYMLVPNILFCGCVENLFSDVRILNMFP